MLLALADLTCETCGGYVHPFLDRCPGCDAQRRSHYEALLADPALDANAVARDPAVVQAAADRDSAADRLPRHTDGPI